jgi:hypothetical protein
MLEVVGRMEGVELFGMCVYEVICIGKCIIHL